MVLKRQYVCTRHLKLYQAFLFYNRPVQIKPKSFESRRNCFLPVADAPHVYVRAWALGCFHSLITTQTFWRALIASVDSCAETKSAPQWRNQFWQSLEEGAGKRCSECGKSSVSVANRVCASDVVVTSYPLASSTHTEWTRRVRSGVLRRAHKILLLGGEATAAHPEVVDEDVGWVAGEFTTAGRGGEAQVSHLGAPVSFWLGRDKSVRHLKKTVHAWTKGRIKFSLSSNFKRP